MEKYRKFDFASLRNSKLTDGFWKHRTDNYMEIINSMLDALLCPTNSARLTNFVIAAGDSKEDFYGAFWSDGDCYKFLEGCLYVYQNTKDEQVKAIVDKYVDYIVRSFEPDGYINTQITLTNKKRWKNYNFHELYNIGHYFTFAAAHKDITGEDVLIEKGIHLVEYLYHVFKDYPVELAHFGFNPSQIMGLCDFYRISGYENAMKLAEIFVNMRGSQPGGTDQNQTRTPLRKETKAVGHAVTSTYLYAGATDVYAATGDEELMTALSRIWDDLMSKRIYITGGVCPDFIGHSENGDETFEAHSTEYVLPNKIAYNESCANIGTAMWCMRMLAVTLDPKYGDMAEQIMYNAGISGSNLELTRYFYSNPLAYRKDVQIPYVIDEEKNINIQYLHKATKRWHTFDCWCCPPQLLRTMAGIGRWVYGVSDDALYVNLFTSCNYESEDVKIAMKSNYPWEDKITLTVEQANNKKVNIRIPQWCAAPTVNGTAVASGYYEMVVNTGDVVEVILPMKATFMQANPNVEQDRGMIAIKRGPVIYCAEGIDNECSLDDLYIDVNQEVKEHFEKDLLHGVVTLEVPCLEIRQNDQLYYELLTEGKSAVMKMIPYYTWANREESDMSVWFPKQ